MKFPKNKEVIPKQKSFKGKNKFTNNTHMILKKTRKIEWM